MAYNRWHSSYGSNEPITYVRGFPVDLTTLIVALHIVSTLLCTLALALITNPAWVLLVQFTTTGFWHGKIWTIFTDPFFHNIASEHIMLAVGLYFFHRFGTEIERLIGRSNFGFLYLALMIVPALACLVASPLLGVPLAVRGASVSNMVHFSVFVGFAYIYPSVMFFGGITARWVAIIFIAIAALVIVAVRDWTSFIPFTASLATVYFFLKFVGAGRDLGILDVWHSWRQEKQDKKIQKRKAVQKTIKLEQEASVDAILDKISQHGIQSLTAKERAFLEDKGTQLRAGDGKGR